MFFHDHLMRCVGGTSRKYELNRPALPSLWHVQEGRNFTQIEVVALEGASFLLMEKSRCPLVNPIGDDIFAPLNQPLGCAPRNLLVMVVLPSSISHLIQMFGQNQGMGGRFIVPTLLNYPFCDKTSGRWDELLKPHY